MLGGNRCGDTRLAPEEENAMAQKSGGGTPGGIAKKGGDDGAQGGRGGGGKGGSGSGGSSKSRGSTGNK